METLAPVLANAGVAGVVVAWFMLRNEKRMEAFTAAQWQTALQLVKLQMALPNLPEPLRAQAQADAAAIVAAAQPKQAPAAGVIAQLLGLLGLR